MAIAPRRNNIHAAFRRGGGGVWALLLACVVIASAEADNNKPPKLDPPQRHVRTVEQLFGQALDLEQPALVAVRQKLAASETQQAAVALLEYFRQRPSPRDPQVLRWRESTDIAFVDYWEQDASEFPRRYSKDGRINWHNDNNPPKSQYESFEIRNRLINLAGWTAAAIQSNSSDLRRKVVETFLDWYRDCPAPELPVSGWWDGHKTGFAWQEIEVALRGRMLLSLFLASLDWKEAPADFHLALLISMHQSFDFLTSKHAPSLLEGCNPEKVAGDKGYDSDELVAIIEATGAEAVIPPRANRTERRAYDKETYKERNLVERFFNKIKNCRRVATRYDKTATSFLAIVCLAATMVLLA